MGARQPDPRADYVSRTRQFHVNVLFLMPWVVVYELALLATRSPLENAAGAWLKDLGATLGRDALLTITLLTCVLLSMIVLLRVRQAREDSGVFGGMLVEGLAYGAALGLVSRGLTEVFPLGRMVPLDAGFVETWRRGLQDMGLAIGAGIFEELVFRGGVLMGVFLLVRHAVGADRVTSFIAAILLSSWLFSAYHHWGATGEPYDGVVFTFRFWAGACLGAVFVTRGLGIAAFAHGFYDVLVLVSR